MVLKNEKCWYKDVCTYDQCTNCIRYSEMRYLIDNSGIPKNRQCPQELVADIDLRPYIKLAEIKDNIVPFVESGQNLFICSTNTGNGKTSWSIKLLLKYFDSIWAGNGFRQRGYFQHVPTLLNVLKDFNNSHDVLKVVLETVDLVVFDDIASTKLSDWDISQLLTIIDQRTMNGLSSIYTGNIVNPDQLVSAIGSRLTSRIWNTSTVIEFKGKDRRHGSTSDYI